MNTKGKVGIVIRCVIILVLYIAVFCVLPAIPREFQTTMGRDTYSFNYIFIYFPLTSLLGGVILGSAVYHGRSFTLLTAVMCAAAVIISNNILVDFYGKRFLCLFYILISAIGFGITLGIRRMLFGNHKK